ncbi:MAG: acyl-CoA dehydrogenase family protein [Blastococcus sp.]
MTTVADRLDAARRVLAGRSPEIEAAGRLPDDVVAAVRATGIFRMWLPCELGGAEARPAEVIATLSTLAAADSAAGWCAGIGMASNLVAGYLPRNGAEEVFATGDEIAGGSLMPAGRARRTDGGDLLVSGQWPFGSGAYHSDWLAGGALLDTGGAPEVRLVLLPRHEVDLIAGSWEVAGLRGTGSVDYRVAGAVVPERRTVRLASLSAWPAGAMWRIPMNALLLPVMAAVPLGIARAALAELTTLATAKTPYRSTRTLAERESTQSGLARATAGVEAAAGYLAAAMTALFDTAEAGAVPALEQRAATRLAAVHAAQVAADAVEFAYRTGGTTALRLTSPLQRHLRDVNACTQHYALADSGYETVGRVLLGLPLDASL